MRTTSWFVLCLLSAGCAPVLRPVVVRPAAINLRAGLLKGQPATLSVGQWGAASTENERYSNELGQLIKDHVVNAPLKTVEYLDANGMFRLDGRLDEHKAQERVTSKRTQCSRYNEKTKKSESYPCTEVTRSGQAVVRASLSVISSSGKTVGSASDACSKNFNASAYDEDPPTADWDGILRTCRENIAANLAKSIVSYNETVTRKWPSALFGSECGDAQVFCDQGVAQLQKNQFMEAQETFTKAVEHLKKNPSVDTDELAVAYYGLTLASEFYGDYTSAEDSLKQCSAYDPRNKTYLLEQLEIDRLKSDQRKKAEQEFGGITPTTPSVEAGTPGEVAAGGTPGQGAAEGTPAALAPPAN